MTLLGKEFKFVLPEANPQGYTRIELHDELQDILVNEFKGFTLTYSESVFFDEDLKELIHDNVIVYTVVLPQDTLIYRSKLEKIVAHFAFELEQDSFYCVFPNGESHLIPAVPMKKV